jgi:hypothetical protein
MQTSSPPSASKPRKRRGFDSKAEPRPVLILPEGRTTETKSDVLWVEFLTAFGNAGNLTLRGVEAQYIGLRSIARLYRHHAGQWSYFLATKQIKRAPTAKSDFQPIVKYGLSLTRDSTGHATKLTTALDEWARADPPIPADQLPEWLKVSGGVKGVYQAVLDRKRPRLTRDQSDAAFHQLVDAGFAWKPKPRNSLPG